MGNRIVAVLVLIALLPGRSPAQSKLKPEEVPAFQLRARALSAGKEEPSATKKFTFHLGGGRGVTTAGKEWSEWMSFSKDEITQTLKGYPAIYMKGYPVVTRLIVNGGAGPTKVEAELKFDGSRDVVKLEGELYGTSLGILVWRDEKTSPQAATMAGYNRRYWKELEGVQVPEKERPKKFPIVDRFIGGDEDRIAWREGIDHLARAGFSAIMLPPSRPVRDIYLQTGLRRTAWAVYSPPGYAFDHDPKVAPDAMTKWAEEIARPYLDAGYAREDMALFAMSDEPGWYYPHAFKPLVDNPVSLARFRDYLKGRKLTPADLGAKGWDEVKPIGRSAAKDLPSRRLFYWTMRFFAWDSSRHFAESTKALEKAFYKDMPILTNWNFFSGRLYVPGPVANNPDKTSPDAAMGGHDWLEFGRMRGGTMLWTEDWFGDGQAYQWSFYCSRLRCAAEKGNVQFGGYVIPRTAGDREDGILQKILCVAGSGGKAIKYFVFGPEYNFPGNCYSERARLLPKMAEAHRMIGAAEELLWPGRRPRPEVAILMPKSAQMWDAKDVAIPKQISDATNANLNRATADYLAEVFDLYLALQHANVPVDFVEEEDLSAEGLRPYRVVYVTPPNLPEEGQRGLVEWVKAGGTLVTVSGAGSRDRYDEPCSVLADAVGIKEEPRDRLLVAATNSLKEVGKGRGNRGEFTAAGVKGAVKADEKDVRATFDDKAPAVIERAVGKGRVVHFAWMPGLAYWKSSTTTRDKLPVGFSESVRRWIVWPTELAKVRVPVSVDRAMVETPILVSKEGAALTLLNWTGEEQDGLKVTVRAPFRVGSVESVRRGKIRHEGTDEVTFTMKLGAGDIVMLRP